MTMAAAALLLCGCGSTAIQETAEKDMYLFSYFNGNGDGLHLAYSNDGMTWEALRNDTVWLLPEIGKDKLMRDPSIVQDEEGTFHMYGPADGGTRASATLRRKTLSIGQSRRISL